MGIKKGVTLIELLIAITVIAVGIFPLLGSLSNLVELLILQKDQLSAISIGKNQMDIFLNQYQFIDTILESGATNYPPEIVLVTPGLKNKSLLSENYKSMDLDYNDSHFRMVSYLYLVADLSGASIVTYRIELEVWKIANPQPKDITEDLVPNFGQGDILLFELASLYSQRNKFDL